MCFQCNWDIISLSKIFISELAKTCVRNGRVICWKYKRKKYERIN